MRQKIRKRATNSYANSSNRTKRLIKRGAFKRRKK